MTILILGGNAYRLASDDTLETAAVLTNGRVENDWGQVAFDLIPEAEQAVCFKIAEVLELASFATMTDRLCNELRAYCDAHGLPQMSADELALEIAGTNDHSNPHVRWLSDFSDRWDAMVDQYHVVTRG